jgi:hypothetical protein
MWKHILIQGLYQMFWLFFFMYGAPVLFERYRITDHCTFATTGPHESQPDPLFCTNELVNHLGFQVGCAGMLRMWRYDAACMVCACLVCSLVQRVGKFASCLKHVHALLLSAC